MIKKVSLNKKRTYLRPIAWLYGLGISFIDFLFKKRIFRSAEFDIPVISVGNLSVGGAGKTPMVIYLSSLINKNYKSGIISRGYGRKGNKTFEVPAEETDVELCGDEPLMVKNYVPESPLVLANNRIWGVIHLLNDYPETEVILLDDAFQHKRLKPGLNILITPFHFPFFNNELLPAGNLRESRSAASRADMIIVSKCPEQISDKVQNEYKEEIKKYSSAPVFFTKIKYKGVYPIFNPEKISSQIPLGNKLLLAAIADTKPFEDYFEKSSGKNFDSLFFRDHYRFQENDMATISNWYSKNRGNVFTTVKDEIRLNEWKSFILKENLPIFVVETEVEFCSSSEAENFDKLVLKYIEKQLSYYKS
ncbi:MAG: tetraacyldisaccharide 4'-kinase [Chitinophagaceae bacterium]|nr:MAG: tetraacyldisaccharide 4'-kinase [Chitinophagaceae bacterium]